MICEMDSYLLHPVQETAMACSCEKVLYLRGVGGGGVLDPNKTHPNIYEPYVVTFANQTPRIE